MKLDGLLLLQHSDCARVAAEPERFGGLKLLFLDPGIVEEAARLGLDPGRFEYRPLAVDRHFQARASSQAMTRALALDHRLAELRATLFGEGVFAGWDHVPLRFFFLRALVMQQLGRIADAQLGGGTFGVLRPRAAQQFYFDSFVTTDVFTAGRERWRIAGHYDEVAHHVPGASAVCLDFPWIAQAAATGRAGALVHIPTVYAHLQHYVQQIGRRHAAVIDLPSPFWDIPIARERPGLVPLARLAPEWAGPECRVYRERVRAVLDESLADLLPAPAARAAQVDAMADHALQQAVNYQGLARALRGAQPHIIVTEHDTGTVGPLFTLAERLGSEVTVLPHSSYPTQPLPHGVRVTAVERDGFASPVRTVWGARVRTRPIRLAPRPVPPARPQVRRVVLLLNTLASRGISYIDFAGLAHFHQALAQRCAEAGVALVVRAKPGAACLPVLTGAFGIPPEALQAAMAVPMAELAAGADVCICYGELTSGAIDFFEAGSWVMHVSEELRPNDLVNSSNLSTLASLPSVHAAEALPLLATLMAEPTRYTAALGAQQAEFGARLMARSGQLFDD